MFSIDCYSCSGERGTNEDAFLVQDHSQQAELKLVAVADGQGGRVGGKSAAWLACRVCLETAQGYKPAALTSAQSWFQVLDTVDKTVFACPEAGFTTVIAFAIAPYWISGGANGDSALLTFDGISDCRILTEQQPKNPPVGSGIARFGCFFAHLSRPWTVLAMSDGVWKYTGWAPIQRSVSLGDGRAVIEFLRGYAAIPSSGRLQDDFTLLVMQDSDNNEFSGSNPIVA